MARIRTVKPEFWTDPASSVLSDSAQVLALATWHHCDDRTGVFDARPGMLKSYAFAAKKRSEKQVEAYLKELVDAKMVFIFTVDGVRYGCFRNFARHQNINRPSANRHPEPIKSAGLTEGSVSPHGGLTEDSPPRARPPARVGEGKGKEGKGKEGKEVPPADAGSPPAASASSDGGGEDEAEQFGEDVVAFVESFREDYRDNVDDAYEFAKPIPRSELRAARAFLNDPKWPPDRIQRLKEAVMTDQHEPKHGSTWKGWAFEVRSVAKFREKRADLEAKLVRGC